MTTSRKAHDVDIRDRIVMAALPHVAFDGWSPGVLRAACADVGIDPDRADLEFPHGVTGAIEHLAALADRRMVAAVTARKDWDKLGVTEKVYWAVRTRLEQWPHEREAMRRAAAHLALPLNLPVSMKITATTCDAIWRAAGDKSADFNWYTKRATLAAIYTATVLYWLDDTSDGFQDTWDFLERRLDDLKHVPRVKGRVQDFLDRVPNPIKIAKPPIRPL